MIGFIALIWIIIGIIAEILYKENPAERELRGPKKFVDYAAPVMLGPIWAVVRYMDYSDTKSF